MALEDEESFVFDAALASAQESGLRENCTSRLSERAEAGRKLHLSRLYIDNAPRELQRGSFLVPYLPRVTRVPKYR